MNKEQLREEWNELNKPRLTFYNKLTDMEICALCGVDSNKMADWWLSKLDTYTQSLVEKVNKLPITLVDAHILDEDQSLRHAVDKSDVITILKDTK